MFLTVARGAADFLGDGQYGLVVVHNYLFGSDADRITQAALRLGPHGASSFLAEAEKRSAAGAFQALADGMSDGDPKRWPPPVDQLDSLRRRRLTD